MEIKNTRPYEAIIVSSAVVIYVVNRLFDVAGRLNTLVSNCIRQEGISRQQILTDLINYSHPVNAVFPIIGGAVLLLAAWFIFHLAVWPRVSVYKFDKNAILYISLSLALIFASLFLFHWFVEYIRYHKTQNGNIIGLKVFSLYRKKTVLADAIGISFLFVFYELVSGVFHRMQKQVLNEKGFFYAIVAGLLFTSQAVVLLFLSFDANIPTPLWSGSMQSKLFWISSIVVIWIMQEYIVTYLLPNHKAIKKVNSGYLFIFAGIWIFGNALIWCAHANFNFHYSFPFLYLRTLVLQLIRTLIAAIVFTIFRKMIFKEKIVLQQQVAGTSAELAQLRSQINPHFLFNALNSLYAAAMKEAAEKTADGIQRLGDMMRFMLQENNQERISVEKEIEYLHNYIHLQRIRIDETQGIEIKVVLNQPDTNVYIAPMMLIPFVENAFKHGISHRSPSWIFITLSFDAKHLYFRVQNSRHMHREADPEEYQSGIGLDNVQKRLNLLYPGRHTLQIQESHHDYIAALTISLW